MTFEEWALGHYGCDPAYFPESADAKAAWDAAMEQAVPEGYVLVPVEPTEAMVEEGEIAYVHGGTIEAVYKAMIQAAQEEE